MMDENRFERLREKSRSKPHGVRARYMAGCRCGECRRANTRYEIERSKRRRWGDWNGIVSATRVRRHLRKLARQGVGYKQVAAAAGVGTRILAWVKSGERNRIRARTERRVLAVDREAIADRALVDAARSWRLVGILEAEGFSRARIAKLLGMQTPRLQIGRERVTALTESKLLRLVRRLVDEP